MADSGGSGSSKWYNDEARIRAFLARIDAIVHGPGTPEAKARRLETDPATREFLELDFLAKAVVDHWDEGR